MANRMVVYDPQLEIATLVDMEEGRALGPVGVGPNAREEMLQFVGVMPPAVYSLNSYDLRTAYMEYWQENFAALYEEAQPAGEAPVVPSDGAGDDEARLAEREATAAGDGPPEPQPADTDMGADESAPAYVGPCFNCNGTGHVNGADADSKVRCNLCQGTGRLPVEAVAT